VHLRQSNMFRKGFWRNRTFDCGAILVGLGTLLLLYQLNLGHAQQWFSLTAAGTLGVALPIMIRSKHSSARFIGACLLTLSVLLELERLGFKSSRVEVTWPVFVVAVGLFGMWRALTWQNMTEPDSSSHLNLFSILGGGNYRVETKHFSGGKVAVICGGFDVDLRAAEMEESEATIDVVAVSGGGVIRVPASWKVEMQSRAPLVLAGQSLQTREALQSEKTLIIRLTLFVGRLEVTN
jgi:hypothetical protein